MTVRTRLASSLLLAAATITSPWAMAQTSDQELQPPEPEASWYQFDVLLFRQDNQSVEQEHAPEVTNHDLPTSTITLYTQKQLTVPASDLPRPAPRPRLAPPGETKEGLSLEQHSPTALKDRMPDLDRDPLILLPRDKSHLSKAAQTLRWSRDYQLMWQGSWRMPLIRDTDETIIRIEAGPQVGNNHEIEGVIALSLKRYLHAQTNIWVNTLNPVRPIEQILAGAPLFAPLYTAQRLEPVMTNLPGPANHYNRSLPAWPTNTRFYTENMPFQASKRLSLNTLIYLDNPKVGMLIRVSPWPKPEGKEGEHGNRSQTS